MDWKDLLYIGSSVRFMGLVTVPIFVSPFLSLLVTQLIIPGASFTVRFLFFACCMQGHFSGILCGFLVGVGLMDWISDYLFLCCLFWYASIFINF